MVRDADTDSGAKETVTPEDLEAKAREIFEGARDEVSSAKPQVTTILGIVAILFVLITYIMGRRAGRKRSAIVEIRRL